MSAPTETRRNTMPAEILTLNGVNYRVEIVHHRDAPTLGFWLYSPNTKAYFLRSVGQRQGMEHFEVIAESDHKPLTRGEDGQAVTVLLFGSSLYEAPMLAPDARLVRATPPTEARPMTPPSRYVVVDGHAYWLNGDTLMHAPVTPVGQIAWQAGAPVEAMTTDRRADITDQLVNLYASIDGPHRTDR
jgi:hypothetical protein